MCGQHVRHAVGKIIRRSDRSAEREQDENAPCNVQRASSTQIFRRMIDIGAEIAHDREFVHAP